jgi:hypothetical protein
MLQKLLYRTDVGSALQNIRRKTVPQRMHTNRLADTCLCYGLFERTLQSLREKVMPSPDAGLRIC